MVFRTVVVGQRRSFSFAAVQDFHATTTPPHPLLPQRPRRTFSENASDDGSDREAFGFVGAGNDDGGGSGWRKGGERRREREETDERPQHVSPSPPRTPTRLERRLKSSSSPVVSPGSPRPLRYWARRIHRFLLSIRELRTVPERDTESLEKYLFEIRRAEGKRGGRSPSSSPLRFRRELPGPERSEGGIDSLRMAEAAKEG